ncbi:MAG TPA: hypothetical protein VFQ83_03780 [Candidatus Udaeobacter sp.]|nr:hypothetical protein [Candidatus Udaeobacter sp.]
MKTLHSSTQSRFLSRLQLTAIVTLLSVAAAMAWVALHLPVSSAVTKANKDQMDGLRQHRVELFRNKVAIPGPEREGGPTAAAEEAYLIRAAGGAYVPFELTRNAHAAWSRLKTTVRKSIHTPVAVGAWSLAGPSSADFPDVLTFSGAAYTTSGRITALAIDPTCKMTSCRVWAAAAGGGIWRTGNALSGNGPSWTFVSGSFATNAIGTLTYDAARSTLYAGTGEPNASGDSEAGFGIYKSTDGGDTWVHLASNTAVPVGAGVDCTAVLGSGGFQVAPSYSGPAFDGRAISSIVIDPGNANIMYVSSARGVRGISSVAGGAVSLAPGLPPLGLWKSTDGGANFTLLNYQDVCLNPTLAGSAGIVQSSFGATRGVHEAAFDPSSSSIIYAAPFPQNNALPINTKGGVWRSTDSGGTWTQIKNALNATLNTDRASFAVTPITGGLTRMYVGVGNTNVDAADQARVYRTDDAVTATDATFIDLTAVQQASGAPNQTLNYCGDPQVGAQCVYDNVVYSPPGKPDVVYLGGSYNYSNYGFRNNGRAFLRSTDAGATFTDMTWDATTNPTPPGTCCQPNPIAPNGMHPDQHAIVEIPGTDAAIFGSDGGLVRSSGTFSDISSQCTDRGLSGTDLATCQQLLSAVPTNLYSLNKGLSTLQFQSLSVAADNPGHLQGGTQDNGTFENHGSFVTWPQIMYGDGGQSGFSATNSSLRFNSFTTGFHDVNFRNGDPLKWVIASGPIVASGEGSLAEFYAPIVADPNPVAAGTIFQGSLSVWRTQDWSGNQAFLEANCPEFTTSGANPDCGDFVAIGPAGATDITASANDYRGTTRAGGAVAALARTSSDTGTLWAATATGRVFVSKNADDATAGNVTYTRLDSLDANSPGRFISGIIVDPADSNHAWISYSSYSSLTPATPGHIFSVIYDPTGPSATWTSLDGSGSTAFPDFPATAIAHDLNGDLYVGNDWGVLTLPSGSTDWLPAGSGLPQVEIAGLTIVPNARKLYAATHGRSAWQLALPRSTPTPRGRPTPRPRPAPPR